METVLYKLIYSKINRMLREAGGIEKFLKGKGYLKLKSEAGSNDVIIEKIRINDISIGQYFLFNQDSIPDPEVRVRLYLDKKEAEVLSYQDSFKYQLVFDKDNTNFKFKKELNPFLNQYLTVLYKQGFYK